MASSSCTSQICRRLSGCPGTNLVFASSHTLGQPLPLCLLDNLRSQLLHIPPCPLKCSVLVLKAPTVSVEVVDDGVQLVDGRISCYQCLQSLNPNLFP